MIPNYSFTDFLNQVLKLFPDGDAWAKDIGSTFYNFVSGLVSTHYYKVEQAATAAIVDTFPSTTVSNIPDWFSSLGLPDPLIPVSGIEQSQAQIVARINSNIFPSVANFENFVSQLIDGDTCTIQTFFPFVVGFSVVGKDPIAPIADAFYYIVNIPASDASQISFVQAELARISPAHLTFTVVANL